jgi:asparagine synthase (glutamine-hydrolysing)
MCGFLAEYGFNNSGLSEPSVFANLLALSKHRGPDSTEVSRQDNFQLGFNRLSILDLSENGNQPKTSPSKRFHVVFNGEIYNYKTLAKTYELKNLMSTSDSEVLVHLLDKIGVEAAIKALNGMFAIAIVDTKINSLYLTRDFAGIKPLFYGLNTGGMVAASQFDQVFKHPRFVKTLALRPEIVKEYFGFGYMQAPNTIYENIFQVNPGELVVVNASGEIEKKDIIKFSKQFLESSETPDFKSVVNQAVNRQLVSDVSVATFLSGGIDSPLIAAYAKSNKPDIEAFTLEVDHPGLN